MLLHNYRSIHYGKVIIHNRNVDCNRQMRRKPPFFANAAYYVLYALYNIITRIYAVYTSEGDGTGMQKILTRRGFSAPAHPQNVDTAKKPIDAN